MRLFGIIFFLQVSSFAFSQEGIVVDAGTQKPLRGASVYIDGSTYGTVTNDQGFFSLKGFPTPPYNITVSMVGYNSLQFLLSGLANNTITLALKPKVVEMQSVTVRTREKDGWERFGKTFLNQFIGYSAFAQKCELKNKKDVVFFYDKQNDIISATTYEPLIILNEALGYRITYWLDDFEFERSRGKLFYMGNVQFTDLLNNKVSRHKKKVWLQNRTVSYNGSLQHFLRCVYQGKDSVGDNGFIVRQFKHMNQKEYLNSLPAYFDSLFISKENDKKTFDDVKKIINQRIDFQDGIIKLEFYKKRFEEWVGNELLKNDFTIRLVSNDGKKTFNCIIRKDTTLAELVRVKCTNASFMLSQAGISQTYSILGKQILNTDSLLKPMTDDGKILAFSNGLYIEYIKEAPDVEYVQRFGSQNQAGSSIQVSTLWLNGVEGVGIYPNGYYLPPNGLYVEKYWSYEKMDKMLPLDFKKE